MIRSELAMRRPGSASQGETVLWLTFVMGLALIGGGILLIYLDPTGGTVINRFGNLDFTNQRWDCWGSFVGQSSWDLLLYGAAEAESGEHVP